MLEESRTLTRVKTLAGDKKIIVVMPAYNAEKTLQRTFLDVPQDIVDEMILADDASADRTVEIAHALGISVLRHGKNTGYGGTQKTCYDEALKKGADIVVMVHPDYQYDPRTIPDLILPLLEGRCDAAFGSRMLGKRFLEGGMPLWKFYGNILLTAIGNIVMKTYLTEWHSGFRAYSRRYLETVHFMQNSNNFVFDTQMIIQGVYHGLKIYELPIEARYFKEASSIDFSQSVVYGCSILASLFRYKLHTLGIRKAKFLR